MPPFDDSKQYKPKEETFFGDGREIELLRFIYDREDINEIRGSPERVLAIIDEFARTQKYLMNVGEDKGSKVAELIAEVKPDVMVEMGGYIGYSTLLFANAVGKSGGTKYFTLERNAEFAAVISSLVELAGLNDLVKVVVGSCDDSIRLLRSTGELSRIDMMFLDHWKPAYTTDLKLCEELKLVVPGTVIAADNVIAPGNPPYLEYVRSGVRDKQLAAKHKIRSEDVVTRFGQRTANQYARQKWSTTPDANIVGNPNLIYTSCLVPGFEPSGESDGVEVTRCIGIEQSLA